MKILKSLAKALAATLLIALAASPSTLAATAGWMINGTNLTGSAALSSTAGVDKTFVLEGGGLNIECTGNINTVKPEIKAVNTESESSVIFSACKTSNANCTVPITIGTVPLTTELTLEGPLAVKGAVRAQSGTLLATVRLLGEKCAVAGIKSVTGDVEAKGAFGQDERTDQLVEVNQVATGLLKLASSAASITGAALELVATRQSWSFL